MNFITAWFKRSNREAGYAYGLVEMWSNDAERGHRARHHMEGGAFGAGLDQAVREWDERQASMKDRLNAGLVTARSANELAVAALREDLRIVAGVPGVLTELIRACQEGAGGEASAVRNMLRRQGIDWRLYAGQVGPPARQPATAVAVVDVPDRPALATSAASRLRRLRAARPSE